MNTGQIRAYRAEVAKWKDACVKLGRPCDDDARRALHAECRAPASSTKFTNAQLDRVLARLRSFSRMDDLAAQLKPDEEANKRRLAAMRRCYDAVAGLTSAGNDGRASLGRANYLDRVSESVCGQPFDGLPEEKLVKLAFVLENRLRARGKAPRPVVDPVVPVPAAEPAAADWDGVF